MNVNKNHKNYYKITAYTDETPAEAKKRLRAKRRRAERKALFIAKATARFDTPAIRRAAGRKFEEGDV